MAVSRRHDEFDVMRTVAEIEKLQAEYDATNSRAVQLKMKLQETRSRYYTWLQTELNRVKP